MTKTFKNILEGAISLFDFFSDPPRASFGKDFKGRTDKDAIRSDWERVGDYLQVGLDKEKASLSQSHDE